VFMKKFWQIINRVFNITLALKALDGFLQFSGGLILGLFGKPVDKLVYYLTQNEIAEDHHDFVANALANFFNNLSLSTRHFISIYLVFHGLVNLFLVFELWKRRIRAFPIAIVLFLIFLTYQFYRFFHTHSINLLLVSILDIFIIILTAMEYERLKKHNHS